MRCVFEDISCTGPVGGVGGVSGATGSDDDMLVCMICREDIGFTQSSAESLTVTQTTAATSGASAVTSASSVNCTHDANNNNNNNSSSSTSSSEVIKLPKCGHLFHAECLLKWVTLVRMSHCLTVTVCVYTDVYGSSSLFCVVCHYFPTYLHVYLPTCVPTCFRILLSFLF